MKRNLRDHGLQSGGTPDGVPTWEATKEKLPCPNCGGQLVQVTLPMKDVPRLRGSKGVGHYLGCPCCPYASPMMVTAGPKGVA